MIQYPLNSRVDPLVHLISKSRDLKSQIWVNPCLFNNYARLGKSQKPPTYTAPGTPAEFVGAVDTSEPGIFSVDAVIPISEGADRTMSANESASQSYRMLLLDNRE